MMCDVYEHWNRISYKKFALFLSEPATTSGSGLVLARDTGMQLLPLPLPRDRPIQYIHLCRVYLSMRYSPSCVSDRETSE